MNWIRYEVSEIQFKELNKNNKPIPVSSTDLIPNFGVEIYCNLGQMNAIYDAELGAIRKLNDSNPIFKSMPNRDLILLNDHLLNDNINTLIIDGLAGTGKTSTICSHLVTGLMQEYKSKGKKDGIPKAYISKPYELMGKSRGLLPGDIDEKTKIEFQSFTQYFDRYGQPFLADVLKSGDDGKGKKFQPMLELLMFEYLRGRDIEEGWVVLDESQNTNEDEMISFVSRVCDPAKLIIAGDSSKFQIDKKGNSSDKNGLSFVKKIYKGKKYAGYVEFQTVAHVLRGKRLKDLFAALKEDKIID